MCINAYIYKEWLEEFLLTVHVNLIYLFSDHSITLTHFTDSALHKLLHAKH